MQGSRARSVGKAIPTGVSGVVILPSLCSWRMVSRDFSQKMRVTTAFEGRSWVPILIIALRHRHERGRGLLSPQRLPFVRNLLPPEQVSCFLADKQGAAGGRMTPRYA